MRWLRDNGESNFSMLPRDEGRRLNQADMGIVFCVGIWRLNRLRSRLLMRRMIGRNGLFSV